MTELATSILVIFSEVGAVLLLIAIGTIIYLIRRNRKDRLAARHFIEKLHEHEVARKQRLIALLETVHKIEAEPAATAAHAMLTCEKAIYNRVLHIFLGHDRDALPNLQHDVENMAKTYHKLVEMMGTVQVVERGENPKQNAQLRLQIKQLENDKAKLEKDLAEAMTSMENMLKEYTQMYSGGGAKKEGVKHIENELSQLKQKISENLVEQATEDDLVEPNPPSPSTGT